jgi:hypothetical protein
MKKQNNISMAVVNANVAGIDVGSRQHYCFPKHKYNSKARD